MSIRITAVRLSEGGTSHEHITDLQWVLSQDGSSGSSSRPDLVSWIAAGKGRAFVGRTETKVAVGVVKPTGLPAYLRTCANDVWTDNLLALPRY